jgi:hypothetical protein
VLQDIKVKFFYPEHLWKCNITPVPRQAEHNQIVTRCSAVGLVAERSRSTAAVVYHIRLCLHSGREAGIFGSKFLRATGDLSAGKLSEPLIYLIK